MFNYTFDHDAVIKQLGLESADEDFKAQVIARISQLLSDQMGTRVMAELSNEELVAFDKIDNKEEGTKWLEQRFPNHQQMYAEELENIVGQIKAVLAHGK